MSQGYSMYCHCCPGVVCICYKHFAWSKLIPRHRSKLQGLRSSLSLSVNIGRATQRKCYIYIMGKWGTRGNEWRENSMFNQKKKKLALFIIWLRLHRQGLLEHLTFSVLGKFREKLPAKRFNLYTVSFSNSFAGAMFLFLCLLECRFMLSGIAEAA